MIAGIGSHELYQHPGSRGSHLNAIRDGGAVTCRSSELRFIRANRRDPHRPILPFVAGTNVFAEALAANALTDAIAIVAAIVIWRLLPVS